jgi:pantetheine-phosphate adenylyltransferase
MKVCVGGTFNILHKGHEKLLEKAFEISGENGKVYIGVIDGEFLKNKKFVVPLKKRLNRIKEYLQLKSYTDRATIKIINDIYGLAADWDFDAIVVSPESLNNAKRINKMRIKKGKLSLKIIKIPYFLAQDGMPISSTRIHDGIINREGQLLDQ